MDRATWDRIVSGAGAVLAIALIMIGAAAVYGGNFGRDNVQDRLQPEKVTFPPLDAMTPDEQAQLGEFAGQTVDTGPEAEAFARYIGGHLAEVNEGKTYSETSAAARQEPQTVDRVVLTSVVRRLTRPRGRQDLEGLVEHPGAPPVVELLAGHRVLVPEAVATKADPESESALAQPIERRGFPGNLDRASSGKRRDHRAEPDALGGGRDRRQRDPRVGHVDDRLPPAHVIPHEHSVPAGLLGLGGQTRHRQGVGELVEER